MYAKILLVLVLALVPNIVIAATTIDSIIIMLGGVITSLIPITLTIALLFFLWNGARYILVASDPKQKEEIRTMLIWGVVIMFVLTSIWGLVAILQQIFATDSRPIDPVKVRVLAPDPGDMLPEE